MSYPGVTEEEFVRVPKHMVKAEAEFTEIKDSTPKGDPEFHQVDPPQINRKARRTLGNKKKSKQKKETELTCPSGDTCLVKRIEMEDLVEHGLLSTLDSFSKKLFPNKLDPAGRPIEEDESEEDGQSFFEIMADDEKRETFKDMAEQLICLGVLDPVVRPRNWGSDLDEDEISFSDLDLTDTLYLFNYFMAPINGIAGFR